MGNKEEFDFFIDQLLDNAVSDFKETEQHRLLREKLDRMDSDCETKLNIEERRFVTECFELLLETDGQQEHYVYRKGMKDCVFLLKELGVLA
jgi:hypothetical protein